MNHPISVPPSSLTHPMTITIDCSEVKDRMVKEAGEDVTMWDTRKGIVLLENNIKAGLGGAHL